MPHHHGKSDCHLIHFIIWLIWYTGTNQLFVGNNSRHALSDLHTAGLEIYAYGHKRRSEEGVKDVKVGRMRRNGHTPFTATPLFSLLIASKQWQKRRVGSLPTDPNSIYRVLHSQVKIEPYAIGPCMCSHYCEHIAQPSINLTSSARPTRIICLPVKSLKWNRTRKEQDIEIVFNRRFNLANKILHDSSSSI